MRVEFTRPVAAPGLTARPGQVVDLPEAEAAKRIKAGHCTPVDEPKTRLRDRLGRRRNTDTGGSAPPPEAKPVTKMNVDELKAHAAEHGIDLGDASKKADILAVIEAAVTAAQNADDG